MKPMKLTLYGIVFFACLQVNAQSLSPQVLSNAGGTVLSPEMRISWTLGEVAVSQWQTNGNSGSITEGFHQPYLQVSQITYTEQELVKIVPNPVREMLNLFAISNDQELYIANLQDAQGRILIKNLKLKGKAEIDMSIYPAGVYFLSIRQSGKTSIQNHKVVKL